MTSRANGSASTRHTRDSRAAFRARLAAKFTATPRLQAGLRGVVIPMVSAVTHLIIGTRSGPAHRLAAVVTDCTGRPMRGQRSSRRRRSEALFMQ